jgi:hypothetical protein
MESIPPKAGLKVGGKDRIRSFESNSGVHLKFLGVFLGSFCGDSVLGEVAECLN